MTQIDFYILQPTAPQSRETYACRLTEKAFKAGKKVFLYTESFADAQRLNTQLWTFKGEAFLPHDIYPDVHPSNVNVRIGYLPHQTHPSFEVLINLTLQVPPFFQEYERVLELINQTPDVRETGRQRFRYYRELGFELKSHEIEK
jgi:DNA polymerase III subunit chi